MGEVSERAVNAAARAAHEANRLYCGSMGDFTQVRWEDAPQWQRDSCLQGVRFVLGNPDSLPEDQHENWMKLKRSEGWKYGPIKSVERKEHPCLVAYEDLPINQRVKDSIFRAVVESVLGELSEADNDNSGS